LPLTILRARVPARSLRPVRGAIGVLSALCALESFAVLAARGGAGVIPWLPGLPVPGALAPFFGAWFCAALLFAAGVAPRLAGLVAVALAGYTMALDQSLTTNHGYLLWLEVGLLTLAAWTRQGDTVARWPLALLQYLLSIVYFFAAVSKLNPDFLSGAVLGVQVGRGSLVPLPEALLSGLALHVLAAGLIATEIFLAFGLWGRRTCRAAVAVGVLLHASAFLFFPFSLGNWIAFAQIGGGAVALYPLFIRRE
jgi:hypothetical protein